MNQKGKNRGVYAKRALFVVVLAIIFLSPVSVVFSATYGLIPCNGPDCTFDSFVQLAQNLINYLIMISIPLTAIAFAYAGFLMVTSAGSEEKIKQGKAIFGKVLIGFLFILGAWLIVYTITTALLTDPTNYTLLTS